MSSNPRTFRTPVRLIVSVEAATVAAVDDLMAGGSHHRHRNRSEFVRLAIERELARCRGDDFRAR
ncbi:MAG: hypothetical protein LAT81_14545 [Oceanicaulis sp.]|nr:hypothetical protein [Oceanicaulis sp.]